MEGAGKKITAVWLANSCGSIFLTGGRNAYGGVAGPGMDFVSFAAYEEWLC
jgi:hypothetical protein